MTSHPFIRQLTLPCLQFPPLATPPSPHRLHHTALAADMSSGFTVIHFAHAENVRIRIPEDGQAVPMNYYFGNIGNLFLDTNINPGSINISAGNIRIIHNWASTGIGAITVSAENIGIVFHYYHTGSEAVTIDAVNIDMIYNRS